MAAFDTENKRRSALNTAIYRNLPIADGMIGLDDRAMMLFQYAHDSFIGGFLVMNLALSGKRALDTMTGKRSEDTMSLKRANITFSKVG